MLISTNLTEKLGAVKTRSASWRSSWRRPPLLARQGQHHRRHGQGPGEGQGPDPQDPQTGPPDEDPVSPGTGRLCSEAGVRTWSRPGF